MNSNELRTQRAKLVHDARQLFDKAKNENRSLDGAEKEQFEKLHEDCDRLKGEIDLIEKQERAEAELQESAGRRTSPVKTNDRTTAKDELSAFRNYLVTGHVSSELRALEATSDSAGGYLVLPQQLSSQLIQAVDNLVSMRRISTVIPVPEAKSLGIPSLDTDPSDPIWTTELATGDEDSSMSFGKRELTPHPVAKRIKVSNKLLRQIPSVETLVIQRLAYKIAAVEEAAFMSGSGVNQPLGVFTANVNGINTDRDVNTGNSTGYSADNLITAAYTLKDAYRAKASWLFHRDSLKLIRQLKDDNEQYLWQPGLAAGQPDTLLDRPVITSEYAPNTFTNGSYVAVFGDFSNYVIADAMSVTVTRLLELYAATNQVGFIVRAEVDGMPALAEAFVRLKCAA